MRKLLISILVTALPFICLAGGDSIKVVVEDNSSAVTNAVTTKGLTGYLESIYIDVTAPANQTVVIATSTTTLLTATAVTADTLYHVRYVTSDNAGADIGTVTNQVAKHLLVNEPVTVTVTSTQTNVLDTGVLIKVYDAK